MAKNGQTKKLPSAQLPDPINPLGIQSVYCNNMEVVVGALDVRLAFNEVVADHGNITVERRAHVVTPIEHFKAMLVAFQTSAERIIEVEKRRSELKSPEKK